MVSNEELLEVLSNIPAFQKDGKFDPVQYKKVLEANRLPAKVFENNMKEDILKEKTRRMIKESVVLSEGEMQKPPAKEGNVDMSLMQKQERAYMAYVDALKKRAKIKVYEDKL